VFKRFFQYLSIFRPAKRFHVFGIFRLDTFNDNDFEDIGEDADESDLDS
jgi:hypothetical protein